MMRVLFPLAVFTLVVRVSLGEGKPPDLDSFGSERAAGAREQKPQVRSAMIRAYEPETGNSHVWYCRQLRHREGNKGEGGAEVRVVEYDPHTKQLRRNGYAQFVLVGSRIIFIDHHDRLVITYEMGSAAVAAGLLSWRLPVGFARPERASDPREAVQQITNDAVLGTFHRPDGRVVVVQSLTGERHADGSIAALRMASFSRKPQPGDRPLIRDFFVLNDEAGFPPEVVALLDTSPSSTAAYARFDGIVGSK